MTKRWLAPALLLIVALTHYGYDPIASQFSNQAYVARNVFYAFRGIEGAALALCVGLLARRVDVSAVCLWAFFEEGQTTICRVAKGIATPNPAHESFAGLCGAGTYRVGLAFALLTALGILYEIGRNRGKSGP